MIRLLFIGLAITLSSCAARIGETHYFAAMNEQTGEPENFYRLSVSGSAQFSSSRYLSGYYDERAIDLFFNEIRTADTTSTLFSDDQTDPGTSTKLTPLSPTADNGAFVLILSSDADSVANAIGSFAESRAVASAITNLISRGQVTEKQESDATLDIRKAQSQAAHDQLQAQLEIAQAADDPTKAQTAFLRILATVASELGADESFADFDEARTWFRLEQAVNSNE